VLAWGLGLFFAIQVSAGLLLDHVWPLVRFPEAAAVYDSLAAQTVAPRVVFLGSSRTQGGIRPAEICPLLERECRLEQPCGIFNAAVPAGDAIVYEQLFAGLQRRGVQPEYLVIEVNPETLNNRNDWLGIHTYRQLNWGDVWTYTIPTVRAGHGMRLLSSRFFPLFLHRSKILEQITAWCQGKQVEQSWAWKQPNPPTQRAATGSVDWGHLLQAPPCFVSEELRAKIKLSTDLQPRRWLKTYSTRGFNKDALIHLLERCREEHIKTILLSAPVTGSHRDTYKPVVESQFRDCMAELQQHYGLGWVDARDWIADGLFVDNHHLSPAGAVYYSRLITRRMLVPLFAIPSDQHVSQHRRVFADLDNKK
jgi:hypothetical protein